MMEREESVRILHYSDGLLSPSDFFFQVVTNEDYLVGAVPTQTSINTAYFAGSDSNNGYVDLNLPLAIFQKQVVIKFNCKQKTPVFVKM